jgi:hypothetical protein
MKCLDFSWGGRSNVDRARAWDLLDPNTRKMLPGRPYAAKRRKRNAGKKKNAVWRLRNRSTKGAKGGTLSSSLV